MKTGILGGTFDPVHNGHLILGENFRLHCQLDRVLFIPAATSPLKQTQQTTPPVHRLKMLELAIADNPSFSISTIEFDRKGISYTIDTLTALKKHVDFQNDDLYLLIGSDNLQLLSKWHSPEKIMAACQLVVYPRPGYPVAQNPLLFPKNSIIELHSPQIEISSTLIRNRRKNKQSIRYLVSSSVENYILNNKLYE